MEVECPSAVFVTLAFAVIAEESDERWDEITFFEYS